MRATRAVSLTLVVVLVPATLQAQSTYEALHVFSETPSGPFGRLVEMPDGALYGLTRNGGSTDLGALLRFDPLPDDSLKATTIHTFSTALGEGPQGLARGADGALYGTTCRGGAGNAGTAFKYVPGGTLTVVHSFAAASEVTCPGPVTLASDGNFYGPAFEDGFGRTLFFRLTPAGEVTVLGSGGAAPQDISAPLVAAPDGHLYGVTAGSFFRMTLDGAFSVLTTFGAEQPTALLRAFDGNFYVVVFRGGVPLPVSGALLRITPAGARTTVRDFPESMGAPLDIIQTADGRLYGVATGPIYTPGLLFSVTTSGQLTTLHQFTGWDGIRPWALVQTSDGTIYGTMGEGGPSRRGVVFRRTATGVAVAHAFSDRTPLWPTGAPQRGPDGALYGTTCLGGDFNAGTVYRLNPENELTVLHSFAYWDGFCPFAALTLASDGMFYGTARVSGLLGRGTVFRISPAGVFTPLHFFGANGRPVNALVEASDGNLYGTFSGPPGGVFRVALNGTVTVLHEFGAGQDDFRHPLSGLTQGTDGALYGSTSVGTVEFTANRGAAFRMTLEGSLTFLPLPNTIYSPIGRLVPTGDGDFYGTTQSLHLFRMTPDGAFTVVHAFNVSEEGIGSGGDLLLASDGNIYGTTRGGGIGGGGTIFSMTPSGEVTILHSFFFNDLNPPWHSLSEPSPGMIYGTTTYGGAGAPFGGPGDKGTIFRLTLPAAPVQRLGAIERCGIADRVEQAGAAAPAVMTPTVR